MSDPPSEQEQFVSALELHRRLMLKVCWAYARTPDDRDDLFQEIAGRLWSAFGNYDRNRKFSTWMYRVALNVAIDFRRRQRRHGRELQSLEEDRALAPAAGCWDDESAEQLRELHELFDQQTDDDRGLLLLYVDGNSYREIGEVLGISESNVGTRLNRLREALRRAVRAGADR